MKFQRSLLVRYLAATVLGAGLFAESQALTVNLTAEAYNATMPNGDLVTMWGYRRGAGVLQSPGAQIIVPPGDTVLTINLTNNLPMPTSLIVHGLNQAPSAPGGRVDPVYTDITQANPNTTATTCVVGSSRFCRLRSMTHEAAASGGTASYTFTNVKPGTYMYQSGTLPQIQVQMGLYGMVSQDFLNPVAVPPTPGQAYSGLPVDNEVKLVFSEVDPVFHQAVVAGTFTGSTLEYQPRHFRVNRYNLAGTVSTLLLPSNQTIGIDPGSRQLVRMVNAGLQTRVPMLSEGTWYVVAEDGNPYPYPREQHTAFMPAAKSMDVYFTPFLRDEAITGRVPGRIVSMFDRRMAIDTTGTTAAGNVNGQFVRFNMNDGNAVPEVDVSTCATTATQGVIYNCAATGAGDGLAFSLLAAPAGMTIDSASGLINWTPGNAQAQRPAAPTTLNNVTVRVTSLSGANIGRVADASFSVAVANVNDAPIATGKEYTVLGGTITVDAANGVLNGAVDPDGDTMTAAVVTQPVSNGAVTMNPDGSFTYTAATVPLSGSQNVTFTFAATDAPVGTSLNPGPALTSVPATVTLRLRSNQRPIAANDNFNYAFNVARPPMELTILANDRDTDGTLDVATVALVGSPSRGGTVVVNPTGTVSYTPAPGFRGTETFTYTVKDNLGAVSNSAVVRVTVR